MSEHALEGLVAQVITARELVINIGAEHGVEKGMKFVILEEPIEVVDPVTKEKLTVITREKGRVEAKEVRPKATICSTYETKIVGTSRYKYTRSYLEEISPMPEPRMVVKTLRKEDRNSPEPLALSESYVQIGDSVRQLMETEEGK